jgi:ubiquitin-conjugating enzyme E2 G1
MLPSASLLRRQLKEMQSDKGLSNVSAGLVDENIYEWEVILMISDECKLYGGVFFSQRDFLFLYYCVEGIGRWTNKR